MTEYGPVMILVGGLLYLMGLGRMIIRRSLSFTEWGTLFFIGGVILGVTGMLLVPASTALLMCMTGAVLTVVIVAMCIRWPS